MPRVPVRPGGGRRVGAGADGNRGGKGGSRDRTFLEFVLDQLHGLRGLESRAMFGGHGLYQGPVFFAIVHRGRVYFRCGEGTRPDYEARGMRAFRPGPRQTLKSYFEVPADVLEDAIEATRWARAAVAEAPASKAVARR